MTELKDMLKKKIVELKLKKRGAKVDDYMKASNKTASESKPSSQNNKTETASTTTTNSNIAKVSQMKIAKPKDERQKIIDEIVSVRNEAKTKNDESYGDAFEESVRYTKRYKTQMKNKYITLFKNKFGIKPIKFKHLETDEIDFDDDIDEIMKLKSKPTKTKTTKPKVAKTSKPKPQPKPIDDDSDKPTVDDYASETQFKNYKKIQQTFPDVDRDIINEIYWSFAQIAHLYIDRCSTNEKERLRKLNKLVIHKVEESATKEPATINAILTCLSMMRSFNKLWKKDKSKMFDSYQLNEWLPASYFSFKSAKNFDKSFTDDMLYPEYRYFMSISLHDIDIEIKKSVEKQYGFFIDDLGNKATLNNKTNKSDERLLFESEEQKPKRKSVKRKDTPSVE